MSTTLAMTIVGHVTATPISATFGPAETMAAARAALVGAGFTVYTDGANSQIVARPMTTAEGVPGEAGM